MSKKREILRLIDRDCVSSTSAKAIKDYIEKLSNQNSGLMFGRKNRGGK